MDGSGEVTVRTPNWLGDLVMSLPALEMIRRSFSTVTFWSHSRVAGLLPVFFPGSTVRTEKRIPGKGRLLLMTDSFRSALQGFLSGFPHITGHRGQFRGFLLKEGVTPPKDREHHHSLDYIALARALGASGEPALPECRIQPSRGPHVALFAGARYGGAKIWPGYKELVRKLEAVLDLPAVFYGTFIEKGDLLKLAKELSSAQVSAGLSLPCLAASLSAAVLTVGNDSGGVHLSAALGVPTAAVFGSTSPVWTAPMGDHVRIISGEAACSPCFKRECPHGEPSCMTAISTEHVLDVSKELLKMKGVILE